jgi:hypothetical protein
MTTETTPPETASPEQASRWSVQRIAVLGAGVLGGIIVLIFLIGVALAVFTDAPVTAARIEIVRDIFVIVLLLEGLLIVASLAVLVVQVGRLINLLQSKSKPILEDAQETVSSARGTVEFVGKNVTEPLIQAGSFITGVRTFVREVMGIRRAIRPGEAKPQDTPSHET